MTELASPIYLLLLLPAAFAGWHVYRKALQQGTLFSATAHLPDSSGTWRILLSTLMPLLTILGITLAIIALARPRDTLSRTVNSSNSIAIEMVVDVSGSMEGLDLSERTATGMIPKTRLDAVKETFTTFIKERRDDLIGLITFGGYATTRAPLTTDHEALLHVLKGVKIPSTLVDKDGKVYNMEELQTAIGDAIATACARIKDAEPVSKVIILLSDGESNTGIIKPEQAVSIAKELGFKIYTIGIGKPGNSNVPVMRTDGFGRKRVVQASYFLDERTLKFIASSTGGRYFNASDKDGLNEALEEIDSMEKTEIQRDVYERYNEKFVNLLFPAILLILLGTGLNMILIKRVI